MNDSYAVEVCPQCKQDLKAIRATMNSAAALRICPSCQFPVVLVAGKYRIERMLGEGAFGKVYLARHVQLQRDAERAIKILKPEFFAKAGFAERFIREVQVTSSISQRNEHIVRVYDDFGEITGVGHFYIMEFLEGGSLLDLLEHPSGQLPRVSTCIRIFGQICKGMAAAHEGDIVHRDLKPENIVLIERGNDPHFVKIVDFGIARPLDSEAEALNLTQGALGTPLYMAPEQCAHKDIDARTDIYSMGIILFEMLVGYPPFAPPGAQLTPFDLLTSHLMQIPPSPRALRPDRGIPEALDAAVLKALEKKRQDRFQTVKEFWAAVRHSMPSLSSTSDYGSKPIIEPPIESTIPPTIKGGQPTVAGGLSAGSVVAIEDEESPVAPSYQEDHASTQFGDAVAAPSAFLPTGTLQPQDTPIAHPTHGHSGLSSEDLSEYKPNRKPLWILVLLMVLGVGGGVWYGVSAPSTTLGTQKTPQVPDTKKAVTQQITPRPAKPMPEPTPVEPPPRDAGVPVQAPRRIAVHTRKIRRRRRRRTITRPRPVVVARPLAPTIPTPTGCPANTGLRWTKLTMQPTGPSYNVLILRGSGQIRRIDNAICIGFSGSGSIKVQIKALAYRPCTLRLRPGPLYKRLNFKRTDPDGIEQGGDDYCR